jgi:hypothetical protein
VKYQSKNLLNNKYTLKMKDKKVKQVLSREWVPVGGGRVNEGVEGKQIWLMYFVYAYENRKLKPVEIVIRSREGGEEE